jgi:short-subunit dehydrogenase
MGQIVFLTGASSGLGAALAPLLAADGDTVVLTARRADALEQVAAKIRADGNRAVVLPLDVTDRDAVHAAIDKVEREIGPIDVMVANAGVGGVTPMAKFEAAAFESVFRANLFGPVYCFEAVLPRMIERKRGHLVGVASLAGYRGLPANGAYAGSKAALKVLMESLRIEAHQYGLDVTTIEPGFVKTPMTAKNKHPMPFIIDVDEAARHMRKAIRDKASEYAFPWQLASIVKAGRVFPNSLYDRALAKQRAQKD